MFLSFLVFDNMVLNILVLLVGMFFLIKGADWFVDGASNIAKKMKIPSIIIGLTLVSMGTSAPEAAVSISAALKGLDASSVGNIIGSNIFNTLFILGASAIFTPLAISKDMKKYDIPIMIGIYVILILCGFVITPGKLDLVESIIFILLFASYIAFLILRAKKTNKENEVNEIKEDIKEEKKISIVKCIILTIVGLAGIVGGGTIVVNSAEAIAKAAGMSDLLVGLTILAVGTSLPELVTSIVASIKKESDIAVGNVVGSNIFNVIFILGASSTISRLSITNTQMFDMLVMLGSGLLLLLISFISKKVNRVSGIILFLLYVAYLTFIIIRN